MQALCVVSGVVCLYYCITHILGFFLFIQLEQKLKIQNA